MADGDKIFDYPSPQPAQWSYAMVNGVAVATYPGDVNIKGNLTPTGGTFIPVVEFGAVGDNLADDSQAIIDGEAACGPGDVLWFQPGIYKFTRALLSNRQRPSWRGAGFGQSILNYAGAATNIDILTVGDGITPIAGATFDGLSIQSTTTMTAGAAARFRGVVRSQINLMGQGQDAYQTIGNKLWHGLWFDQMDDIECAPGEVFSQADAIRVNGGPLGAADLTIADGTKIGGAQVGTHCGGGFGGLYINVAAYIDNFTHVLVDQGITAVRNREIMLNGTVLDVTTGGPGIKLADPGGPTTQLCGVWLASSTGPAGLLIDAAQGPSFTIVTGSQIFNHTHDGIRCNAPNSAVSVFSSEIYGNGGWAINPAVPNTYFNAFGIYYTNNTLGNVNPANPPIGGYPDLGYLATIQFLKINNSLQFDPTFYQTISAGNPTLSFDANDYQAYDRTNNAFGFYVAGAVAFQVRGRSYRGGPSGTLAALGSAGAAGENAHGMISDSTVAAAGNFGALAVGGGGNVGVPVYSDGAAWRIG